MQRKKKKLKTNRNAYNFQTNEDSEKIVWNEAFSYPDTNIIIIIFLFFFAKIVELKTNLIELINSYFFKTKL